MAVTLVSTGVQFPDSSIQTTAATAGTMTLISTTTSTSGTTVVFTGLTSSYRSYQLVFSNVSSDYNSVTANVGTYLVAQLSNNNGASYITSGYLNVTGGPSSAQGSGSSLIPYNNCKTNSFTPSNLNGTFTLYNPATASIAPTYAFYGVSAWVADAGYGNSNTGFDNGAGSLATIPPPTTINALKFYWQAGSNFTKGTWKLYGVS